MKGVGWGPAWHSCREGTAPSQLLHPPLRSRGQGSRCLAREAPHQEPPSSLGHLAREPWHWGYAGLLCMDQHVRGMLPGQLRRKINYPGG